MESSPSNPASAAFLPIPVGAKCARHVERPALFRCADCGTFTCSTCDLIAPDGAHLCAQCTRKRNERSKATLLVPVGDTLAASGPGGMAPRRPPLANDVRCVQHRGVAAVAVCGTCGAYMCETCRFEVPGGIGMCPVCAMEPKVKLSHRRRAAMIGAFALACLATTGLVLLLMGNLVFLYRGYPTFVAELAVALLTFHPALAGVALSIGSMDRKLGNPPALWGAAIWNTILLVGYIVLAFIGSFFG